MLARWLAPVVDDPSLGSKMRVIAGPRQCGKTVLAKSLLEVHGSGALYYNWDTTTVRRRHRQDPLFYRHDMAGVPAPWGCFDEMHKVRGWKSILKGIFDEDGERITLVVTGSARLDLLRRGGDSMAGRFFPFRLSPVLAGELCGRPLTAPPETARSWIEERLSRPSPRAAEEAISAIERFGAFPEPLLKGDERFARRWRSTYIDSVVQGDLRDLTRVRDLDKVEQIIEMLPARVGSPLSVNALREDIEVAFGTVRGILAHLERLFVTLTVPPYAGRVSRPVRKASKVYLFEWSPVAEPGARFESLVAIELWGLLRLWSDSGEGRFDLAYVRDRAGHETDFLILREKRPWCLIECKLQARAIEAHHRRFARALGGTPLVQLVRQPDVLSRESEDVVTMSAARLLVP